MTTNKTLIAALVSALWSVAAFSQALQEQTYGSVRYLTGGIGQDEAQAMRAAASRYPLALTFTAGTGQYLSDVKVTIKGRGGETVLSAVSGGPMMLVDLAPGQYAVEASSDGQTQTRKVNIAKGRHQRVVMRWNSPGNT